MCGNIPLSTFGEVFICIASVHFKLLTSYTTFICKASLSPHKPDLRNVAFAPIPAALIRNSSESLSDDLALVRR